MGPSAAHAQPESEGRPRAPRWRLYLFLAVVITTLLLVVAALVLTPPPFLTPP